MYRNQPGIFDHPPLKGNPPPEITTGDSGSGNNKSNWIIISVVIVLCGVAGYLIYRYHVSAIKDKDTTVN